MLELLGILDDADSPYSWLLNLFPDDRAVDGLNCDRNCGGTCSFWSEQTCSSDLQCPASECNLGVGCSNDGDCRDETFCDLTDNGCSPLPGCCDQAFCDFTGFPCNDGDLLYEAWSQVFVDPAVCTPGPNGLLVTKLRFRVLATGSSQVRISPFCGVFTLSQVFDGNTPNLPVCCGGGATSPPQGVILNPPATVTVGSLPTPTTAAEGSRYLRITPGAGTTQVALKVKGTSSNVSCVDHFVKADGTLGTTAVFRTGTQWGTVHVRDRRIIPSRTQNPDGTGPIVRTKYSVEVNCGTSSTAPQNVDMWLHGDLNGDDAVDLADILLVLDAFSAGPGTPLYHADMMPCDAPGDGVDLAEILVVLDAFAGIQYAAICPPTCP